MADVELLTSPAAASPQRLEDLSMLTQVAGAYRRRVAAGDVHPVRHLRRLLPLGSRHGPHAAACCLPCCGPACGRRSLKSNTFWMCVSCYHCVVRCPQNVHIADVMYTLKSMAIEANLYQDSTAPDFSQTFIGMVEDYGRSFELGLASRPLPEALSRCGCRAWLPWAWAC